MNNSKILSFFTGCGALDYGINSQINAKLAMCCELDKDIQQTLKLLENI